MHKIVYAITFLIYCSDLRHFGNLKNLPRLHHFNFVKYFSVLRKSRLGTVREQGTQINHSGFHLPGAAPALVWELTSNCFE